MRLQLNKKKSSRNASFYCYKIARRQHLQSASCRQLLGPRHRRSMFGSVVGPFLWPARRPGSRYHSTFDIRRVLLTVFVVTWKLFFSRSTSLHSALGLRYTNLLLTLTFIRWRAAGDGQHVDAVQVPRRVWIVLGEDLLEVAGRHAHRRRTHLSELRRRRGSAVAPSAPLQAATPVSGRAHRKR